MSIIVIIRKTNQEKKNSKFKLKEISPDKFELFLIEKTENFNIKSNIINNNNNKTAELQESFTPEKINFEILKEFSDEDFEFEKELAQSFLEEIPKQLKELEKCIKNKNFEEIRKACHKIKSPISYYGLNNLILFLSWY